MVTSGFCETGAHEGKKPLSFSGKPRKTCPRSGDRWSCSCKCHTDLDKLYEATGQERVRLDNPDYVPFTRPEIWMPTIQSRVESALQRSTRVKLDGDTPPVFNETETGKVASGQLEYWVKLTAEAWWLEEDRPDLTVREICKRVSEREGVDPSPGAVHAVLTRWKKIGYAFLATDPIRFMMLTPDGVKLGLDHLRAKAKEAAKLNG